MEDDDDEKIEEMIDDISTNEMFGSSILSMENQEKSKHQHKAAQHIKYYTT